MESGVHLSLHPNSHHQVVFTKFNLFILYPPPYEGTVWFYKKSNPELIQRAINEFDWVRALSNVNVDKKVCYFTETLLNIIRTFIPLERIVCDYRDPPWVNNEIKELTRKILLTNHTAVWTEMCFFWKGLNFYKTLNVLIENFKQTHYSKLSSKLANPATSSKTSCSILKSFLNNEKISCMPTVFHENKFITNFKQKAEFFNTFFAHQHTLLNNSNVLPDNLEKPTNKSLDTINLKTDDISKVIMNLEPNKAHSHDMLSIKMIKLCGNSICKQLSIIFNDCHKERKFSSDCKKTHVVPVHKKEDKQSLKNYRPISLLPICSKIFKRSIYNNL